MAGFSYQPNPKLDLVLERTVEVPKEHIWKAWTTPEVVKKWFTPAPWTTVGCEIDLRPGGIFSTVMRAPDGKEYPNVGCFLEIVPNERLVWTDALSADYRPTESPFATGMILLESNGRATKYRAIAIHKDEETAKKHAEMGFHQGWGIAFDQLINVVKSW